MALFVVSAGLLPGCFSQRSFPARLERVHVVPPVSPAAHVRGPVTTRTWLRAAHEHLASLLPDRHPPALLTADLVDADGRPVNVLAHFRREGQALHTLLANATGLSHTAQATGADTSDELYVPPWPGFEDLWIPVSDDLEYFARLGVATEGGAPRRAPCIMILPGLFGDIAVWRTRDVALALRAAGFHAVAIEPRGIGRTNRRYPELFSTFGALEARELMAAAAWLQQRDYITSTGLIGFCWGANEALTTAYESCRAADHPSAAPRLVARMRPPLDEPVFTAGYIAFSPVLRFEEIVREARTPTELLDNPVINALQTTVANRMRQKQHPRICGDLGLCIDYEFERTPGSYPGIVDEAYAYLRLLPFDGLPDGDKLECARAPVLIVQAANDPLTSAQNVADLIARTDNPNVAAIVLPGGGHVGFAPYARDHFYSLLLSFFDPQRGAAAAGDARATLIDARATLIDARATLIDARATLIDARAP